MCPADRSRLMNMIFSGSGRFSFQDFIFLMTKLMRNESTSEVLQAAFSIFDKDGNGQISSDELQLAMMNLGERMSAEEVSELIQQVDIDGDGQISYKGEH